MDEKMEEEATPAVSTAAGVAARVALAVLVLAVVAVLVLAGACWGLARDGLLQLSRSHSARKP
jgi:hypothetical protein